VTPRFVAFEGGDAAGKSTQAERLAARTGALLTREPGGTPVGEAIRALFLDPATGHLDPRTEALLLAAARAQHAATVIRPALQAGRPVVTDRYLYSSVAYQGHGRGLDPDEVRHLSIWGTDALQPDAVVLLDLPVEVARARLAGVEPDRLESEDLAFHRRVRAGYHAQAEADPDRWIVVDADGDADTIWERVWGALVERLPDLAPPVG
jgi:dTMP kinase